MSTIFQECAHHFSRPAVALAMAVLLISLPGVGCATAAAQPRDLQENLIPGHEPGWYEMRLRETGYQVTAVNYDTNEYREYEIVRGKESYEVQLEIGASSGMVEKVTVATNPWKAAPTSEALERNLTTLLVPASTRVAVKLNDYLDSGENRVNDAFGMTVAEPVLVDGQVAVPVGTRINGHVASVESARRPNKGGRIDLKADSMVIDGETVDFEAVITAPQGREGASSISEDLKEIAVGAGVGGLVGGLIGGGKGVLAGVLIGGGGMFAATKGEQIELSPDTELIVEIRDAVRVPHSE